MIQCRDCEYYKQDEHGRRTFSCDPFTNIKEPECLGKWQILRLDFLVSQYQSMRLPHSKKWLQCRTNSSNISSGRWMISMNLTAGSPKITSPMKTIIDFPALDG